MRYMYRGDFGRRCKVSVAACALLAGVLANSAFAQEADAPSEDKEAKLSKVLVLGSQIQGAKVSGALPVTVVSPDDIEATGAVSAEDLFRTVPSAGDITFNGTYLGGGNSNAARGDISTVSLRGLAQGNTLVLINGRRSVVHPTSQTDNQTPVFGYNVNAIPVQGLARVEVLKDGAAAIYGSDAVAGVVNNVMRSDFVGLDMNLQYGVAEGTSLDELTGDILYGRDFDNGKGNISVYLGGTTRSSLLRSDQEYTNLADMRPLTEGTNWAGTAWDNRSTSSPWGYFAPVDTSIGAISADGSTFTDAAGAFHIQAPGFGAGCLVPGSETCYGGGSLTSSAYRDMRYDELSTFDTLTMLPSVDRINFFSFANYDVTESLNIYGEIGIYKAETDAVIGAPASLGSGPVYISADAYWNPLGAVGSPNRIDGLSANVPDEGVPLRIGAYRLVDTGTRDVNVKNDQYRFLVGAKGDAFGWNWDSALLYNEAKVKDSADGVDSRLFQQALNRTDSSAYNPFCGGDPVNPSVGTTLCNSQETIDSFMITQVRENKTSLSLVDFKVSKADLFSIWAGDIGIAGGLEFRRETYHDDRDPHQDGSLPYYDQITGNLVSDSSLMGHSPSPDVKGSRNVSSAYLELAVPLISEEMNIPLARSIELQLAARYENYSDVGSVSKPKVSAAWDVFDGLRFRGSWSEGFKAPNLEVVNTPLLERVNGYPDFIQCEAALRQDRIGDYSGCSTLSVTVASLRSGNSELEPEESESSSYGVVFEPQFLPEAFGHLTFTTDFWSIEQKNPIGLLNDSVALSYDYLLRLQGSSNPNVIRMDPTPQQVAEFAGTGLEPVGDVLNVIAKFTNQAPLEVKGIDYGAFWDVKVGPGDLSLSANATYVDTYYQSPTEEAAALLAALSDGTANPYVTVTGGGSLIQQGGRPVWKYSMSASYAWENWKFGAFSQYTGDVYSTSVSSTDYGPWPIEDQMTWNFYGQYTVENDGWTNGSAIRVGVRNAFNEDPPLADTYGYLSSLYQPLPRYWYVNVKKSF
ncbi:MAG: TonB-dependent receptor [Hyphomonas sp.]|uniref:TonB-dependent receptor domain-containing protein n=1 Tax=Hyphomonas sp. TaxID=87 RepID=UPI0030020508